MAGHPIVSIIMPCYNTERYVRLAIDSILQQSLTDFELIIIDDGSTDNTWAEVQSFSADNRLKCIRNARNEGNYRARNIGLVLARGKYIAVMDSDDIALSERLAIQSSYLEKYKKVGCVGSFTEMIDKNGNKVRLLKYPTSYSELKAYLLRTMSFTHPSLMFRSSFLKKYNLAYKSTMKYAADYAFVTNCSRFFPVRNIDEVLLRYRVWPEQISSSKRNEQAFFADWVRLAQLKQFELHPNKEEISLHLKLMRGIYLTDEELESAIKWSNKLLEANDNKKLYNSKHLYDLLKLTLIGASRECFLNSVQPAHPGASPRMGFAPNPAATCPQI